jgi:hypothetical protein
MLFGNAYVEITGQPAAAIAVSIDTAAAPAARWVVQALPGLTAGSDGETLDLAGGPATVDLGPTGVRVVVITVLPAGVDDPDTRSSTRYPVTLVVQ